MPALTFRARLFASFSAVLAIGLILAALSAWNIMRLGDSLQVAVTSTAVKLDLINALRYRSQQMLASQRAVLLAWSVNGDGAGQVAKFKTASARIHEQIAEIRPLLTTPQGIENLAGIEESLKVWERDGQVFLASAAGSVTPEALRQYQEKTERLGSDMETRGAAIIAQLRELLKADRAAADSIRAFSNAMNITLPLLLFGVGGVALWVVNRTSRQLQGDVRTVSEAAKTLTAAASHLASASQSLAQSSSEQAASIEETSASSEEVRAMADQNVSQSQQSVTDMHKATELVANAGASLEHLKGWLKTLTDSSRNISRIIRVIDEIAFQTNILALNAAVEAARAGEAGMGFAVVAEEVRNLAQRCAQAASETSGLIEDTIRQSSAGKTRLEEMAGVILELTPVANATRERVEQVRQASIEQTKGINQINTTMGHLNQATQAVAASAEESAAASEEIYAQANSLDSVAGALQALAG